MQIVLFAPDLEGKSGWSRYALDLTKRLVSLGHHVHAVVHQVSANPPCPEYPLLPQPIALLHSAPRRMLAGVRSRMLLQKLQPDIVHFMAEPYALLMPWLNLERCTTCLTIHGSYAVIPLSLPGRTAMLAADVYRNVDHVFSVSAFTKGYVRERFPKIYDDAKLEEKISILPNGVDLSRAQIGQKNPHTGPKRIIGVGAVKARKGFLEAIEALAAFRDTHTVPFVYEIIGSMTEDPAYVARLKARIHQLGLEKQIILRGTVSDPELSKAYAEADLFLLLSIHEGLHVEGFGLVFLEANSWGIPAIGPTTGGCPEAIDEGKSGYVCNPHDAESCAQRIADVLLHHTISADACHAWAEIHSVEHIGERLAKAYARLHGIDG